MINLLLIIPCIIFCARWWRKGGDGQSLWRNPGVAILIGVAKLLLCYLNWWVLLYIPLMWLMIQGVSYGVSAPPHKFWVWVFGKGGDGQYKPVEIATRATCGFCWSLPAAIFAFFSGCWILFAIYVAFMTIGVGLVGGLVKDVEISERVVGAIVSTAVII